MPVTLTLIGKSPQQSQYDIVTLTERYKTATTADAVLTDSSVPQIGDAHPDYATMFLVERYCQETGESASTLDLVYKGFFSETLPPLKNSEDNPVMSATTYTSSAIFPLVATQPASLQYRAHANTIVCWSTSDTTANFCPDPPAITTDDIITWTLVAEQPASDFGGIMTWLLTNAFVQRIVETTTAEEIVDAQYWQITKRKIMNLYPYAPP